MKNYFLFIRNFKTIFVIISALFLFSFIQAPKDTIKPKIAPQELKINLDTLKVENIKSVENSKPWYENNNMPWIISLVISILTVGINIYLSRINQKTAIQNVNSQIDSSKNLALLQFKTTLNTKNRQEWINEVRHSTSDFLANAALFNVVLYSNEKEEERFKTLMPHFEKMFYYKNKIAMLLNANKPEQKDLLDSVESIVIICSNPKKDIDATAFRLKEAEIIKFSRVLFEKHWEKIKEV